MVDILPGFTISKEIDFCYGHRVYSQILDPELSCNMPCKCRHLHGHQGHIKIRLGAQQLSNGMVTDFHNLNWFKKFIDEYFDHKMILGIQDPMLSNLVGSYPLPIYLDIKDNLGVAGWESPAEFPGRFLVPNVEFVRNFFKTLHADIFKKDYDADCELIESLVLIKNVPTSENLSRLFFQIIEQKLTEFEDFKEGRIWLKGVRFNETPKSFSEFSYS